MNLILLIALAALVVLAGLVLTWYHADDGKVFGPANAPGRVLFKTVLQNFWRDLLDLIGFPKIVNYARRLWVFWGPRLTSRALMAVVFTDFSIAASGQDVWTWIAQHPLIALAIIVFNLLVPLTPQGAPSRLPAPDEVRRPQEVPA